ncbi:MAG: hypothetical protein HQK67_02565 [Desulfamplus sp.]|nr:hypothetical protein [Desulfamplus sp.]
MNKTNMNKISMDKKKLAAVTAAVFTYIKTQEEAAGAFSNMMPLESRLCCNTHSNHNHHYPSFWGSAGRNAQMQMRTMMQLRTFR